MSKVSVLVAVSLVSLGACRQNQTSADGDGVVGSPAALPFDRPLAQMALHDSFNGSVLVALPDTVFEQTYRQASAPEAIHTASNWRYPIGELNQLLLRAAYFRLADQGRLLLNGPVNKYLPDLPESKVINYRMLLDHRAGLPDVLPQGARLSDLKLISQPGIEEHYSTLGYRLLATAFTRMLGTDVAEIIRVQVLEPGEMSNTGVLDPAQDIGNLAVGYSDISGQWASVSLAEFDPPTRLTDALGPVPALPEYYSTITDLFYLAQFMPESGFLKGELKQPGVRPGYRSYFYAQLKPEYTVVVLSNSEAAKVGEVVGVLRGGAEGVLAKDSLYKGQD